MWFVLIWSIVSIGLIISAGRVSSFGVVASTADFGHVHGHAERCVWYIGREAALVHDHARRVGWTFHCRQVRDVRGSVYTVRHHAARLHLWVPIIVCHVVRGWLTFLLLSIFILAILFVIIVVVLIARLSLIFTSAALSNCGHVFACIADALFLAYTAIESIEHRVNWTLWFLQFKE